MNPKLKKQLAALAGSVHHEIAAREGEIQELRTYGALCESLQTTLGNAPRRRRRKKTTSAKKKHARKSKRKARLNWGAVLHGLPKTFTVDDVVARPGVGTRGRNQVYPALTRWMEGKLAERIGKGRYRKVK